ncbi:hypothetical protein DFH08DRAFT_818506 [Mycena albidolilacea]|uniref:Uncharacterized protein n=1 Tax=Mycena albidolilacea TaxID=1033008 RepID=A0AAD6ZG69_9AGAR|nr:hypothetical protein DFH08DRAFT_818506 [Mycena albidolilacea]
MPTFWENIKTFVRKVAAVRIPPSFCLATAYSQHGKHYNWEPRFRRPRQAGARAHVTLGWGLRSTETVEQLYACSGIQRVRGGGFPPSRDSRHDDSLQVKIRLSASSPYPVTGWMVWREPLRFNLFKLKIQAVKRGSSARVQPEMMMATTKSLQGCDGV